MTVVYIHILIAIEMLEGSLSDDFFFFFFGDNVRHVNDLVFCDSFGRCFIVDFFLSTGISIKDEGLIKINADLLVRVIMIV